MKRVLQFLLVMAVATVAPLMVAAQGWGSHSAPAPAQATANPHPWGAAQPRSVAAQRPHRYHHPRHHHRRDRDHDRFRHDRDRDHDRH